MSTDTLPWASRSHADQGTPAAPMRPAWAPALRAKELVGCVGTGTGVGRRLVLKCVLVPWGGVGGHSGAHGLPCISASWLLTKMPPEGP